MIAILNWEEPPPARRKGVLGQVDRVVEELKKNPGRWALVEEEASGSTASKKWESSGCEATVRTIEVEVDGKAKKRYRIWVRWPAKGGAEQIRTASQREAAEAYARQHGHVPQRPASQSLAPSGELTPAHVKEQLARRLGHKGS